MARRTSTRKTAFPGVHRLEQGTYRIRAEYRCPKTGRRREIDRVVAAESAAAASAVLEAEKKAARTEGTRRERRRVADYARSWLLGKLQALKPSTAQRYATTLDLHVLPALGDVWVDAVTRDDITTWRDDQDGEPSTINGRLRIVRGLFADAAIELGIADPCARVAGVREGGDDEGRKVLSAAELGALLDGARTAAPAWYPLILTLALTGCRFGEASALRWDDVDERGGVIRVRRSQWHGHIGETKTGVRRTVPLAPELADVLRAHRLDLIRRQAPGLEAGWVFPSAVGGTLYVSSLRKPLDAACIAGGLAQRHVRELPGGTKEITWTGRRVGVHWLRHTLSDLLRRQGDRQVQRAITGHATEAMAEHYSHVDVEERKAALGGALRPVFAAKPGTEPGTEGDGK